MNWQCFLGFHRFGPWQWEQGAGALLRPGAARLPTQSRTCKDCPKKQTCGSSEERRVWESWRDR